MRSENRIRKIVSAIAALSVTASCMTGITAINAGADAILFPEYTFDGHTVYELYNLTGNDIVTSRTRFDSLSGGTLSFVSTNDVLPTTFSADDISALLARGYSFTARIEDTLGGNPYYYTTVLDSTTLNRVSGSINIALAFRQQIKQSGSQTYNRFIISSAGTLGSCTLTYKINYTSWNTILSYFGLSGGSDLFCSYTDTDGTTVVKKMKANSDATIVLTGDREYTFFYDLDKAYLTDMDTINKELEKQLLSALGLTAAELTESMKTYISSVIRAADEKLFNMDSQGSFTSIKNYPTRDDLAALIRSYFASVTDTVTAGANRSSMIAAIIKDKAADPAVDKALNNDIYSVFGSATDSYSVTELKELIWDSAEAKAVRELGTNFTEVSQYRILLDYFFDSWKSEIIQKYHIILTELSNVPALQGRNIYQIVTELETRVPDLYAQVAVLSAQDALTWLKSQYGYGVMIGEIPENGYNTVTPFTVSTTGANDRVRTLASTAIDEKKAYILSMISANLTDVTSADIESVYSYVKERMTAEAAAILGSSYTTPGEISDAVTARADNLANSAVSALKSDIRAINDKLVSFGSQARSSALIVNTFGIDMLRLRQSDISSAQLAESIVNTTAFVNMIRNNTAQAAQTTQTAQTAQTQTSAQYSGESFSEWAVRTYGSIDGFIKAVADQVEKDGYYNGIAGESAYDIAVRNGFRGTEQEWLDSLHGADGKDGKDGKDGRDGKDGKDGKDGQDGQDGRIIYVNGTNAASSAPSSGTDASNIRFAAANEETVTVDDSGTDDIINPVPQTGNYTDAASATPAVKADSTPTRTNNPTTGVAAGVIIPAAALASLALIKKDKRRRGRK